MLGECPKFKVTTVLNFAEETLASKKRCLQIFCYRIAKSGMAEKAHRIASLGLFILEL